MPLNELKVVDYLDMIKERKISVEQVVKDIFYQIDKVEPTIKAYLYLNKEGALSEARKMDRRIKEGQRIPPLAGVAYSCKG